MSMVNDDDSARSPAANHPTPSTSRDLDSPSNVIIDNAINAYGAANSNGDGTDYNFDANAGELDYAAEDYNVNDRTMHYLSGNSISKTTRLAVEITGGIHALSNVTSEETTNAVTRNEKILKEYKAYLNAFDDCVFEAGLKPKMLRKLYNAQHDITGARLYTKTVEWRGGLRNSYMSKLPSNLSTLPSGTGLRDAYNKFILDRYKEANVRCCEL